MNRMAGWCILGVLACGCGSANKGAYAGAAVALAYNVAGAAVNRAVTGDCVASCSYDTQCNHETGYCEPLKERPGRARSYEPTLEERCSLARAKWADDSIKYGREHPEMVALRSVLDACTRMQDHPDAATERCGGSELDVIELRAGGLGDNHPDVLAAEQRRETCKAALTSLSRP